MVAVILVFPMFSAFRAMCLGWGAPKYAEATQTLIVPDDLGKIQDAIGNAALGDTVYVRAGVYRERVFINKSVLLIGENETTTVIESLPDDDAITVTADNVKVSGFTVRNLQNHTINPLSYGIKVLNSHNTTVSDNVITGYLQGVALVGGSGNTVQYNLITRNRYGIFTSGFTINNVISHNVVCNSFWNGIEFDWGGGNIVYANTIINNTAYGLEIPVYAPSLNNIIFHNNFVDNIHTIIEGANVTFQGYGPTPNSWDEDDEGNYWSNYVGEDGNHDGIGDTPFVALYGTVDYHPLMGNFSDIKVSGYWVTMVSNSLVTGPDFRLNGEEATLSMSIFHKENSTGFCRVSIPKTLMADPYEVRLDGEVAVYPRSRELPSSNGTSECLYFDYPPGEHSAEISATTVLSELSLPLVLTLFGLATLLAYAFCRKGISIWRGGYPTNEAKT